MTTPASSQPERSYGCTFACGNPYDFVVTSVSDATTEFLCTPCFVRLASEMVAAVTNPDDPQVAAALSYVNGLGLEQAPGPKAKRGRRNAPATSMDPDVFEAFDSIIETDIPEVT